MDNICAVLRGAAGWQQSCRPHDEALLATWKRSPLPSEAAELLMGSALLRLLNRVAACRHTAAAGDSGAQDGEHLRCAAGWQQSCRNHSEGLLATRLEVELSSF